MKLGKRLISFALALVMVFSLTTETSAADTTRKQITAYLDFNITIKYNDKVQVLSDANGNQVYPISYNGTTYVPIRAIGYLLGLSVSWDGATQTVLLDKPSSVTVPIVTAKADKPAKKGTEEIKTYIEPGITVKYNGEIQSMKDAAGNVVYPVLHEGTTYLPIRATATIFNVSVNWDQATQTVLLGKSTISGMTAAEDDSPAEKDSNNTTTVTISKPSVEKIRKAMKAFGYPDYAIEAAVAEFEATGPNGENGAFVHNVILRKKDTFKTSKDAVTLGDKHVGYGYVEVDYATADDGYVKVKLTEQTSDDTYCTIDWVNAYKPLNFKLKFDQWVNIPLPGGTDDYQLDVCDPGILAPPFYLTFTANIEDPDAFALLSHPRVDFENSPKAVTKAAELTKNCKTDAEKITAIFEFIAKTIKYDYNDDGSPNIDDNRNRTPDDTLDCKKGICINYAVLMACMLRSQGIPCKVVCGKDYQTSKGWGEHAWVSVSPDIKGLNMSRLGAGHDEDGWIRLDPTWGVTAYGRSQAAIDKNHQADYAY